MRPVTRNAASSTVTNNEEDGENRNKGEKTGNELPTPSATGPDSALDVTAIVQAAVQTAKLNQLIANLPEEYTVPDFREVRVDKGLLFVGHATLTGLKQLEPDCKDQVFCKGDQKRIIVSLCSSYLMVSYSWRARSDGDGIIYTYTGRAGYEVIFLVDWTRNDTKWKLGTSRYFLCGGLM
ncbi:hypothetical protein HPB47_016787 [Ixodes persulcatus]|uniref:Uncharacterized protein n=1 Tax=Ixodes persulcatus TaxID=34615 RepID=A0AC60QQ06_IXOPE|nr:hypothetical protein HPB47_016787 [Ixodes persulcatus]